MSPMRRMVVAVAVALTGGTSSVFGIEPSNGYTDSAPLGSPGQPTAGVEPSRSPNTVFSGYSVYNGYTDSAPLGSPGQPTDGVEPTSSPNHGGRRDQDGSGPRQ